MYGYCGQLELPACLRAPKFYKIEAEGGSFFIYGNAESN